MAELLFSQERGDAEKGECLQARRSAHSLDAILSEKLQLFRVLGKVEFPGDERWNLIPGLSVRNVIVDNWACSVSKAELLAGPRACFVVFLVCSQPQNLSKLHTPQ